MSDRPNRGEAIEALRAVLNELPAEFSDGPPGGHTRPEFRVIKPDNVERVHAGLWALQRYFEAASVAEGRLAHLVTDLEADYGPVDEADAGRFLQALIRATRGSRFGDVTPMPDLVSGDAEDVATQHPVTVYVLTEWREFKSVHRTHEGAEAAQAALVEAVKAEWASSGWELLENAADEGPDTAVIESEVRR